MIYILRVSRLNDISWSDYYRLVNKALCKTSHITQPISSLTGMVNTTQMLISRIMFQLYDAYLRHDINKGSISSCTICWKWNKTNSPLVWPYSQRRGGEFKIYEGYYMSNATFLFNNMATWICPPRMKRQITWFVFKVWEYEDMWCCMDMVNF